MATGGAVVAAAELVGPEVGAALEAALLVAAALEDGALEADVPVVVTAGWDDAANTGWADGGDSNAAAGRPRTGGDQYERSDQREGWSEPSRCVAHLKSPDDANAQRLPTATHGCAMTCYRIYRQAK